MSDRSLIRDRDERQRECIHAFPTGAPHSEQAPGPCERCDLPWSELARRQQQVFSGGKYGAAPRDWTPAEENLSEAAALCRSAVNVTKPGVGAELAELFDLAGDDLAMCERQNSQDPDNDGKTRILPHPMTGAAVKLARAMLAAG